MEELNKVYELRKKLHVIAEKSFQENKTINCLIEFIKNNTDFLVEKRDKWFYAFKKGNKISKKPIALRCDMDGITLSENQTGHYCGHDGHCAIMCYVAILLSDIELNRDVYLIFQPAEEIGKGAKICCELLEEKNIKEIYGLHNIPGYPENNILLRKSTFACGSTGLRINYIGKPTHAAYPQNGINPTDAFIELINFTKDISKKTQNEILFSTVVGLSLGSEQFGMSAYKGHLNLTVRAEKQSSFENALNKIKNEASSIAEKYKLLCNIEEIDYFPATENNEECIKKVEKICQNTNITYQFLQEPMRWSEDFGYYLQKISGAFFGIGDGLHYPQLHSECYEFNDEIIETAATVFKNIILFNEKVL